MKISNIKMWFWQWRDLNFNHIVTGRQSFILKTKILRVAAESS